MTKEEVIREWCRISALVYHSLDDYQKPNDGFCDLCPFADDPESFRNSGDVLDFIRDAVVKLLKVRKIPIARGFDPKTGKEIIQETKNDEVSTTPGDVE